MYIQIKLCFCAVPYLGESTEFSDITPIQILLFSSLISAVDPVAVLAVFSEVRGHLASILGGHSSFSEYCWRSEVIKRVFLVVKGHLACILEGQRSSSIYFGGKERLWCMVENQKFFFRIILLWSVNDKDTFFFEIVHKYYVSFSEVESCFWDVLKNVKNCLWQCVDA